MSNEEPGTHQTTIDGPRCGCTPPGETRHSVRLDFPPHPSSRQSRQICSHRSERLRGVFAIASAGRLQYDGIGPNPDLPGEGVRLAMGIFRKRGKYWIDFYADGRRVRECVGKVARRVAEDALKARQGEVVQGRYKSAGSFAA